MNRKFLEPPTTVIPETTVVPETTVEPVSVKYHFFDQTKSWSSARDYCRQKGFDLAAPRTTGEAKKLLEEKTDDFGSSHHFQGYWLGFKQNKSDKKWARVSIYKIIFLRFVVKIKVN